jgi:hypothetical protein
MLGIISRQSCYLVMISVLSGQQHNSGEAESGIKRSIQPVFLLEVEVTIKLGKMRLLISTKFTY